MNNKIKKKSPTKFLGKLISLGVNAFAGANPAVQAGLIVGGAYLASSIGKNKKQNKAISSAQEDYDTRMKEYEEMEYTPIDSSIADQENVYEDMEIDMTGFEMQRKAFMQSQADILQTLKSVGGSSGAAGLAQSLSIQADKQTEQMSMTVSDMLNKSRELRLQEESRINQTMTQIDLANADGARQFELEQLTTLLGVDAQRLAGAKGDKASTRASQGNLLATAGKIAGAYYGAQI